MAEITLGDGTTVKIPDFAAEATQTKMLAAIAGSSENTKAAAKFLKEIAYNTGTSNADITLIERAVKNAGDDVSDSIEDQTGKGKKQHDAKLKHASKQTDKFSRTVTNSVKNLQSLNVDSIGDMTTRFASMFKDVWVVGGMISAGGAVLGGAISVIENYAKQTAALSSVGLGLHDTIISVRSSAADVGISFEDLGKVVKNNKIAIRSLSTNITAGAKTLTNMTKAFQSQTAQYGHFGMTNIQLTEVMAEEIELRRQRGAQEHSMLTNQEEGLAKLLKTQSALADLTGGDRDERLRDRQAMLANTDIATYLATKTGDAAANIGAFGAELGRLGGLGDTLSTLFASAMATGFDPKVMNAPLMQALGASGEELFAFFQKAEFMDPDEFQAQATERINKLFENNTFDDQTLSRLKALGGDFAEAAQLLQEGKLAIRGLDTATADDAKDVIKTYQEMANEGKMAYMGMQNEIEKFTNLMKAAILEKSFGLVGIEIEDAGAVLADKLAELTNKLFSDTTTINANEVIVNLNKQGGASSVVAKNIAENAAAANVPLSQITEAQLKEFSGASYMGQYYPGAQNNFTGEGPAGRQSISDLFGSREGYSNPAENMSPSRISTSAWQNSPNARPYTVNSQSGMTEIPGMKNLTIAIEDNTKKMVKATGNLAARIEEAADN